MNIYKMSTVLIEMSAAMVKYPFLALVGITGSFTSLCLSRETQYQLLIERNEDMNRT